MDKKFNDLLQRYLNNTASEKEEAELWQLARAGSNPDEVLDKIMESLNNDSGEGIDAEQRKQLLANILTERKQTVSIFSGKAFRISVAAAVIMIATVAGAWMYLNKTAKVNAISQQEEPYTISGPEYVRLSDNSTVTLKEGSQLSYSRSFGTSNREVTLTGEALFDVEHDPSKPFVVHTGKVATTVLGTSFNINSSDSKITVTVVRGLVQVGDDQQVFGKIKPDEQMEVDVASSNFIVKNAKAEEAVTWQKDFFILENVTFAEAAARIEKRFNVKVNIVNKSLQDCIVSAWFFNNESYKQVIEDLATLNQATAVIDGNKITIEGGIACKPSQK